MLMVRPDTLIGIQGDNRITWGRGCDEEVQQCNEKQTNLSRFCRMHKSALRGLNG